jgi:hypothetical protein
MRRAVALKQLILFSFKTLFCNVGHLVMAQVADYDVTLLSRHERRSGSSIKFEQSLLEKLNS